MGRIKVESECFLLDGFSLYYDIIALLPDVKAIPAYRSIVSVSLSVRLSSIFDLLLR